MSDITTPPSPQELQKALQNTTPSSQKIIVHNFICLATIGVTAEERDTPQRLKIEVDLELQPAPPSRDVVHEVLNYGVVVRALRGVCGTSSYRLLETLADALASKFFAFENILSTRVRILKLDRYDDVEGIGIEMSRTRIDHSV